MCVWRHQPQESLRALLWRLWCTDSDLEDRWSLEASDMGLGTEDPEEEGHAEV